MYGEGNGTSNTNQGQQNAQVIVLQPHQIGSAPPADTQSYNTTSNTNANQGQKHASSLNSAYPGTQSRAQQLNDGTYDPNRGLAGCTTNLKTFAALSVVLIFVGFILAFLINEGDSDNDCDNSGGMGGNDCNDSDGDETLFTIGLLMMITGLIMLACLLCNMCGCVPCFICCCGPPLWMPMGGRFYYGRRQHGYPAAHGGPHGGPHHGGGGGGGGYPGGR